MDEEGSEIVEKRFPGYSIDFNATLYGRNTICVHVSFPQSMIPCPVDGAEWSLDSEPQMGEMVMDSMQVRKKWESQLTFPSTVSLSGDNILARRSLTDIYWEFRVP